MRTKLQPYLLVLILFVSFGIKAQQTEHEYIVKTNYLLYLPQGYDDDTTKLWPLMVHLHGVGETGHDFNKHKGHGIPRLIEDGKQFPFIILSPQAPTRGWRAEFVMPILKEVQKKLRIDEDRIYLEGLSMGGFGTWSIGQSFPLKFAALIPICGGGETYRAWTLENMPIWCFHGAKDGDVDISYSQNMVDSVRVYNKNIKYTVYPEGGHDAWSETYANDEVFEWMLQQRRIKYEEVAISDKKLTSFEGIYYNAEMEDTIQIKKDTIPNALIINRMSNSDWSYTVKSVGENKFMNSFDNFYFHTFIYKDKQVNEMLETTSYSRRLWRRID